MRCLWDTTLELRGFVGRLWCGGVVSVLLSGVLLSSPVYSQTSAQPDDQKPAPETPATESSPAMPLSASERVMELSLEDAIRLALQHNLDIERERFSPQIERTGVEKGRAAFDPIIGVEASISQTKSLPQNQILNIDADTGATSLSIVKPFSKDGEVTPNLRQRIVTGAGYEIRFVNTRQNFSPSRSGIVSRVEDPRYESSLELSFTQPLLRDFGISVNTADIRQAQKATEIAEQQMLQAILDTVFGVQQSYWELVFRIQDLAAKRESQKLAEDFLAENQARVELGTLAPIELVQAKTRVKTREGDVIVAEAAVADAEDQLKEILNVPETMGSWDLRLHPTDRPPFVPISTISVQEKIREALQKRPDFLQSQLRIHTLEIDRQVARNQSLPRLDFEARGRLEAFGGSYPDSLDNYGQAEGYFWSLGVKFEYPLGNRFARHELQRRNLQIKRAQVDQRRLERSIVRQIRKAVRDIDTAIKRVEVTRAATVLAQTQLEAEQEKFRLGLSTSFVVLDFQEDLTIARSDETRAVSDYNIALGRLDQLTGTLRYGDLTTGVK